MSARTGVTPWVACLALAACRVEHGLDRPPVHPGDVGNSPPPKLQIKQTFDPKTGKLMREYSELVFVDRRPVKDGKEVKYFASGEKTWDGEWKKGRKIGAWRFYYESGKPMSETIYGDARTPTTMTFWHENGRVSLQGPAINGSRQGTWRIWRKNGLLAEEGLFAGSMREGAWKVYSEDGRAVTEIVYSRHVRVSAGTPAPCEPIWADAVGVPSSDSAAPAHGGESSPPPPRDI